MPFRAQRLAGGLLFLYLGAGFTYAWLLPTRHAAEAWTLCAGAVVIIELPVALLIGPLLLATTKGRPPGPSRLLSPGALVLQGAAYTLLYLVWQAQSAPVLIGIGYVASIVLRTLDIARGDADALLDHTARMIVWFISVVLASFAAILVSVGGAALGTAGGAAPWPVKACAVYFLLLAAGEVVLPFFRRNVDPAVHPEARNQD